jgi:hypothetical protein
VPYVWFLNLIPNTHELDGDLGLPFSMYIGNWYDHVSNISLYNLYSTNWWHRISCEESPLPRGQWGRFILFHIKKGNALLEFGEKNMKICFLTATNVVSGWPLKGMLLPATGLKQDTEKNTRNRSHNRFLDSNQGPFDWEPEAFTTRYNRLLQLLWDTFVFPRAVNYVSV